MLVFVSASGNNNKFYHVSLFSDGHIVKRWGRVGTAGTSSTEYSGSQGYDRIIKQKIGKGYKISPIKETGQVKTSSSENHLQEVTKTFLAKEPGDKIVSQLIDTLLSVNRHQIIEQSGGLIDVEDTGVVKTALGIVELPTIIEARKILSQMKSDPSGQPTGLLEEFLTLIPQKVGAQRGWQDSFYTNQSYTRQFAFLDQLEAAIEWHQKTQNITDVKKDDFVLADHADLFRMRLTHLNNDGPIFDRIDGKFAGSRNKKHSSSRMKLVNVFEVEDTLGIVSYEAAAKLYGNVKELWHGTQSANVLSILTKGYFVPPVKSSSIQIHGRAFGDGVYLSDQSTKSLNYATGFWGGPTRNSNCFMFLNDVVMGNEFRPKHWDSTSANHARTGQNWKGKKYQSINVRGGTCGVINNEMIVWDTNQINIRYLCEFAK